MTKRNISYNRTAIVNRGGEVSSLTISRAITIGALTENITPRCSKRMKIIDLIISL